MTTQQIVTMQTAVTAVFAAEPTISRKKLLPEWSDLIFAVGQGDLELARELVNNGTLSGHFFNLQSFDALISCKTCEILSPRNNWRR